MSLADQGQRLGLTDYFHLPTAEECQNLCCARADCTVWQFLQNGSGYDMSRCWMGAPDAETSRGGINGWVGGKKVCALDDPSRRRSGLSCVTMETSEGAGICTVASSSRRRDWGGEAADTCPTTCVDDLGCKSCSSISRQHTCQASGCAWTHDFCTAPFYHSSFVSVGRCLNAAGHSEAIRTTSMASASLCERECLRESKCAAYSFEDSPSSTCTLYSLGPYTQADGESNTKCYRLVTCSNISNQSACQVESSCMWSNGTCQAISMLRSAAQSAAVATHIAKPLLPASKPAVPAYKYPIIWTLGNKGRSCSETCNVDRRSCGEHEIRNWPSNYEEFEDAARCAPWYPCKKIWLREMYLYDPSNNNGDCYFDNRSFHVNATYCDATPDVGSLRYCPCVSSDFGSLRYLQRGVQSFYVAGIRSFQSVYVAGISLVLLVVLGYKLAKPYEEQNGRKYGLDVHVLAFGLDTFYFLGWCVSMNIVIKPDLWDRFILLVMPVLLAFLLVCQHYLVTCTSAILPFPIRDHRGPPSRAIATWFIAVDVYQLLLTTHVFKNMPNWVQPFLPLETFEPYIDIEGLLRFQYVACVRDEPPLLPICFELFSHKMSWSLFYGMMNVMLFFVDIILVKGPREVVLVVARGLGLAPEEIESNISDIAASGPSDADKVRKSKHENTGFP